MSPLRRLQLVALSLACCFAGCRPATRAPLDSRGETRHPELVWLPDGSRVAVDAGWLFDPESGSFASLKCRLPDGAACRPEQLSFAPIGQQYVVVDADRFAVGNGERGLGVWKQIPRWLAPNDRPGSSDTLANVAFWLTPKALFVQQFYVDGHAEPECRLHELATATWRRPDGGCLSPDFSYLARVDGGPNGLLALHSSAEGRFGFSLVRYDSARGQVPVDLTFVLEGASQVSARFDASGSRIGVISPCTLQGEPVPACDAPDRQPKWKLYGASTASGRLQLERDDLPPGSVADPTHRRYAWCKQHELCVGDPRDERVRCATLPSP